MEEELRQLIESKYGDLEKLDPMKRSETFWEIYMVLTKVMKRDLNYQLEIKPIEEKLIEKNEP